MQTETQELICGFCKDTTWWPKENEVYMLVYGLFHIAENCSKAPPDARAEAIVTIEDYRQDAGPLA